MNSAVGTTLGNRYRLEARVGAGGMSTVYRGYDQTLERVVAVKLMNREVAGDSAQLERFRREAKAAARISHPNVVRVIDAGEDEGRPYIVFEYIEGETLKQRIRRLGPLPIREAVRYAIEIARALGAAHANRVVHRDVKPQNVLIDREGVAKVTDFGIARTLEEDGLTADGRVLGTTDYVSPEQALGQDATAQSDLYSLGVALYEMLTGEVPFSAESQVAIALKHVNGRVPDVQRLRPDVPAALAAVVQRATSRELDRRYSDDAALVSDLERAIEAEDDPAAPTDQAVTASFGVSPGVGQQPKRGVRKHRLRPRAAIGAVIVLVAAAIVAFSLSRGGPEHGGGATIPVRLCASCAHAYNPYGFGGNTAQHNAQAPYAVDGNPSTAWSTQQYFDDSLNKPGVGIYVAASAPITATRLDVDSSTVHYAASIYGATDQPSPTNFKNSDWVKLASASDAQASQRFSLDSGGHAYRYYLVWITQLPPGGNHVAINEIHLYR